MSDSKPSIPSPSQPDRSLERVLMRNEQGAIVAEIVSDGDQFVLVRKAKPTFPPSQRNLVIGTFDSLQAAREAAEKLL